MSDCFLCGYLEVIDGLCPKCSYCCGTDTILDHAKLHDSYVRAKGIHWSKGLAILAKAHNTLLKQNGYGWGQEKTAKILCISKASICSDLKLNIEILKHLDLLGSRTADEARKELKRRLEGRAKITCGYEKELQGKIIEEWTNIDLLKDWVFDKQYHYCPVKFDCTVVSN